MNEYGATIPLKTWWTSFVEENSAISINSESDSKRQKKSTSNEKKMVDEEKKDLFWKFMLAVRELEWCGMIKALNRRQPTLLKLTSSGLMNE